MAEATENTEREQLKNELLKRVEAEINAYCKEVLAGEKRDIYVRCSDIMYHECIYNTITGHADSYSADNLKILLSLPQGRIISTCFDAIDSDALLVMNFDTQEFDKFIGLHLLDFAAGKYHGEDYWAIPYEKPPVPQQTADSDPDDGMPSFMGRK